MMSFNKVLADDCTVLLERALLGQKVCAFGLDGCGLYGKSDIAHWFEIDLIVDVIVECDDIFAAGKYASGCITLSLKGYDARVTGDIMTDKNFDISIAKLLKAENIDPACLSWPATNSEQGNWCVTMMIDVPKLLQW